MATDIRGLPCSDYLAMGRLVAQAPAPAGFTVGQRYWPLALAVDCLPANPVIYALVPDDTGKLAAVAVSSFRFAIDNTQP